MQTNPTVIKSVSSNLVNEIEAHMTHADVSFANVVKQKMLPLK